MCILFDQNSKMQFAECSAKVCGSCNIIIYSKLKNVRCVDYEIL